MPRTARYLLLTFILGAFLESEARGNVITAVTCSQSDVTAAVTAASAGDTVIVPSGSCSWSGLSLSKAVTLQGAGIGLTNITLTGNNTVTKSAAGVIRIKAFSFSIANGGNTNKGFTIQGSWKSAQPIVFQNNAFTTNGSGLFLVAVPGGLIVANNSFTGQWDDSFLQIKDPQDLQGSWHTADSMGAQDTSGTLNHYVETNTFVGGTNQGIDCDDACRMVYRYNTLTNSSFNSHGEDTSPNGLRHFEVYNNSFGNTRDTSQLANESQAVWIRGATGVIYNNFFANLAGNYWGTKPEIRMNIRGAEDVRPQGTCAQVSYPVPHQLGQNNNGTSDFTDPIYLWGNTGTIIISAGWNWGNPCGFTFTTFFQWGRDGVNPTGSGGSPKPGYVAFTYPHPLVLSSGTPPGPPTNLQAIVN